MIIEMHCHTSEHSACSMVSAAEMVKKAIQVGIQAIVFTDHHYKWSDEEISLLRQEAGVPETFKIFSGQEVTTSDYGDVLLYGAEKIYPKQKITLGDLRAENPDAAIIWAHPYRNKKIPAEEKLLSPLINGIEIFNSNYTILEAHKALNDWHKYKFTAIGGTDTHALSYTGSYPTIFDHPVCSIGELAEELKAGRCRPFYKEIERSGTTNTKVTEIVIGPKNGEERKKLIIKTYDDVDAWKSGERSHRLTEELFKQGFDKGPCRIPKPLDQDEKNLLLIEERIGGKTLYDSLLKADSHDAKRYLQMTAQWLSKLHNMKLKISPPDEYLQIEPDRIEYYLKSLIDTNNKHLPRVREIKDLVLEKETELITSRPEILVQGHGDFHPKNIYVNNEDGDEYIAVIDFDSSYQLPRAFDAGTFLAQYINMFFSNHEVQKKASSDIFLEQYMAEAIDLEDDFLNHVGLYKARASLSILYYLAKVGQGESENFFRIMVEAEKSLVSII